MAINPATYVKNVGKSFGYAAIEALGTRNQYMSDIKDNADTVKDLYTNIKDFASSPADKIKNNQKLMSYSNDLKDGYKNLISDIKSGNLYNKSRSDEVFSKALGLDFDFDSMFDDIDLDADLEDLSKSTVSTITDSTDREIVAMDTVGSAIANTVSSATARSAEYIVGANAESTRLLMEQNKHLFNTVSTGLIGINKSLGDIQKLGQPLTDHMKNSVTFFTKSTENQEKIITLLTQIADQTKPLEVKKTSGSKGSYDSFLTSSGMINLSGAKSLLKKNAKNALESSTFGMMVGMMDMMGDGSNIGLKAITSNPIGFVLPMIMGSLMDNSDLGKSIDKLGKTLAAFNMKALRNLQKNKYDGGLKGLLAQLFGIEEPGQYKYDTSKYERGVVPFDGETKKAITEVIPDYLSMILSAISGQEQKHYDYSKGKFVSRSGLRKEIEAGNRRFMSSASFDSKREIDERTKEELEEIKYTANDIKKAIDVYVKFAFNTGKYYYIDEFSGTDAELAKTYFGGNGRLAKAFKSYYEYGNNMMSLEHLNARIRSERINQARQERNEAFAHMYNESEFIPSIKVNKPKNQNREHSSSSDSEAASGLDDDIYDIYQRMLNKKVSKNIADKYKNKLQGALNNPTEYSKIYDEILEKYLTEEFTGSNSSKMVGSYTNKVMQFIRKPLDAMAGILDEGSKALYNIMYGKPGEEDKGILGNIFKNIDDMFNKFGDYIKNKFFDPIKKAIEDRGGLKNMIFDMLGISQERVDEIKGNVKSKLKSAGNWVVNNNPVVQAYRNKKGQGSGLVYRGGASEVNYEEASFADKTAHEIKNAITSFLSSILPNKEKFAQDNKVVTGVVKDSISELAQDPSGAIAGALIGGGVSILTGGIVGPLLGASIGAAAGLTINSTKVQELLFGKEVVVDGKKTGERDNSGVLSKELTKFLTQDLKNIAGFGITGAAAALLPGIPGGPVAGLIVGSAIGFANRNNALSNYLFGEKDENGERQNTGLIPKETQDWIKRMLPKGAAGAILGAVGGPFGFVPNILVGAALGFASETDKFKDFIFGKPDKDGNREGGITGMIKDKIINPVAEAINPITSEIKYRGKKLIRSLGDKIANVFKTHVGIPLWNKLDKYIMGPLGKVFGGLAKGLLNVVTLPFQAIGGIGRSLKNRQVQQGRADYMSAEERIAYRNSEAYQKWNKRHIFSNGEAYSQFDQYLSEHPEELDTLTTEISDAKKEIRKLQNAGNKKVNQIIKILLNYNYSAAKKFSKEFKKYGKSLTETEIKAIVESAGVNYDDREVINKIWSDYLEDANAYESSTGAYGEALKALSDKLGIKVTAKNISHIQDMANSQIRHNKLNETKNKAEDVLEKTSEEATISIDNKVDTIVDYLRDLRDSIRGYRKNGVPSNEGPKFDGSKANWNEFQKFYGKDASSKWQEAKAAFKQSAEENLPQASGSRIRGWLRGAGSQFSLFGALKTKFARDGQEVVDVSDKDSRATLKLRDKVFGEFETISDYIKKIFDRMPTDKDKEEEKEEKKGFLESILEGITGEKGLLGGFMSWFGGTTLGGWMAKFSLKNLVTTALPMIGTGLGIAALATILTGNEKVNELAAEVIKTGSPKEENKATDKNGKTLEEEEDTGYGRDSEGNVEEINNRKKGDINTLTENAWNSLIRSAAGRGGTYHWAWKRLPNSKLVTESSKVFSKIASKISEIFYTILDKLAKNPWVEDKILNLWVKKDEVSDSMGKKFAKALEKRGAREAAELLKGLLKVLYWVTVVADFITGWEDARATLGIVDEPSNAERTFSAFFRVLKNSVPILDLLPDSFIIDILIDVLSPYFGVNWTCLNDLKKDREKADSIVAKFNEEHNLNLTKNQYIKQELGDRTSTERMREAIRDTKDDLDLLRSAAKGDENAKKLQEDKTKEALKLAGVDIEKLESGSLVETFKAAGKVLSNDEAAAVILPGLMGDLKRVESELKDAAAKGDVKKILDVQLKYFEGGGVSANGTQQVETNWMTKYMGNVLLQKLKYDYLGEALTAGAVNKAKAGWNAAKQVYDEGEKKRSENMKKYGYALDESDFLTGFGSGLRGSGFVSQIDPSLAGKSFGNSTFGANGCAPSVISMITGMPIGAAAGMAESGYANRYGTSADYFGNVLSAAGIPNEYVYTGAGSAQDYLAGKIASGHPTVLLGQDPYNTSKAYSPFGPGNHYVLATGMTRDGGVVIQDPESRTPNNVYDSSILNSVKLGIPTGGRSGLRSRRYRGGAGYGGAPSNVPSSAFSGTSTSVQNYRNSNQKKPGGGIPSNVPNSAFGYVNTASTYNSSGSWNYGGMPSADAAKAGRAYMTPGTSGLSENHEQIWTFLKSKGLSEEGAAGLMGCWQAESKNRPDRIEGDYMGSFPGFDAVTASSEALDNYALNILFPATEKNVKINRSAYLGQDGHYYPGFGLAQWTGPRAYNLLQFAKTNGGDWRSLKVQLEYAWQELTSKYSGVLSELKKKGDVGDLCYIVYRKYEGGPDSKKDWILTRQQYAADIYTKLSGKVYNLPTDSGNYSSGGNIGSTGGVGSYDSTTHGGEGHSRGTSSNNKFNLFSFGSLFGDLVYSKFGKVASLFGLSKSTGNDEENEAEYNSESSSGYYDSNGNFISYGSGEVFPGLEFNANSPTGQAQNEIVNTGYGMLNRLAYSQTQRNPDQGSADCSSFVDWAYKKVLGNENSPSKSSSFANTLTIYDNNDNFVTVDSAQDSLNPIAYNNNSPGPDISKLQPGDILLYSHKDQAGIRPYAVGHAAMYAANGEILNHGGPGYGPVVKPISGNAKHYIMAKRFRPFADGSYDKEHGYTGTISKGHNGAPSNIPESAFSSNSSIKGKTSSSTSGAQYDSKGFLLNSGTSSSNSLSFTNPGGYFANRGFIPTANNSTLPTQPIGFGSGSGLGNYNIMRDSMNYMRRSTRRYGGGSGLVNLSRMSSTAKAKYMADTVRKLRASGSGSGMSDEVMISMIKAIISLLTNVSANSEYMKVIAEKIGSGGGQNMGIDPTNNVQLDMVKQGLGVQDTDSTIAEMVSLLNNLASSGDYAV